MWASSTAVSALVATAFGGHTGGHKCQRGLHDTTWLRQIERLAAGDSRNDSAAPELRRKHLFAGTSDAGGGTRTPDTRIMIPQRFGSTEPKTWARGHKRGHNCAVASKWRSRRSGHRPTCHELRTAGARRRCVAWDSIAPVPPLVRDESGSETGANPTLADTWSSSRAGVSCVRAETPASVERNSQQVPAPRVCRCSDSGHETAL